MSIREIVLPHRKTNPEFPIERRKLPERARRLKERNALRPRIGQINKIERVSTSAKWLKIVNGSGEDGPPNRPTAIGGGEEERYDVVAEANQIVINSGFSIETHRN